MRLGTHHASVNEEISIDLIIGNANEIAGGMAEIKFDNSIVRVKEVSSGDIGMLAHNISNPEGFVRMSTARARAIGIDEVRFATIVFESISDGSTNLHLTDFSRTNCDKGIMAPATLFDGTITVGVRTAPPATGGGGGASHIADDTDDGVEAPATKDDALIKDDQRDPEVAGIADDGTIIYDEGEGTQKPTDAVTKEPDTPTKDEMPIDVIDEPIDDEDSSIFKIPGIGIFSIIIGLLLSSLIVGKYKKE